MRISLSKKIFNYFRKSIEEHIDWLIKLRKKGGYTSFLNIRKESATWGYELGLADVQQIFLDELAPEEKELPVIKKLYNKIASIK